MAFRCRGVAPNLLLGTTTVLHPLGAFNATETLDARERERATSVFLVPAQWELVLENLLFDHPMTREAAVIGCADDRWGEVPVGIVAGTESLTLSDLEPFPQ